MSDAADSAADRVHAAVLDALADRPEMVTKWQAIVEIVDADGHRGLYVIHSPEATSWDSIGLLTFALQGYQARAITDEQ